MSIRSTLLACISALACIAVLIAYVHKNTRYEMVSGQDGVYILDRQTTLMHHCNKEKCKLLSPEGSSVEAMRALSGIPSVDLVRKKQPQACVVPEKKPEKNYSNVNISSFQSITQPMPSINEIKGNAANALSMSTVNQQVKKPQNPFPEQNSSVPESQEAPQQPVQEEAGTQSNDSGQLTENKPATEAMNNPYGETASNNSASSLPSDPGTVADSSSSAETAMINPYGEAASNGSSSSVSPYQTG